MCVLQYWNIYIVFDITSFDIYPLSEYVFLKKYKNKNFNNISIPFAHMDKQLNTYIHV